MTLYVKVLTVDPNTPITNPRVERVVVEEDVVVMFSVRFPPGPVGLLKVSIWYGDEQIFPAKKYDWACGDDEAIYDFPLWEAPEKPCPLTIKAYNEDQLYSHSCIVRILALPRECVALLKLGGTVIRILQLMLRLLGGGV